MKTNLSLSRVFFVEFNRALTAGEAAAGCFGISRLSFGAAAAAAAAAAVVGSLGLLVGPGLFGRMSFSISSSLSSSPVDRAVKLKLDPVVFSNC